MQHAVRGPTRPNLRPRPPPQGVHVLPGRVRHQYMDKYAKKLDLAERIPALQSRAFSAVNLSRYGHFRFGKVVLGRPRFQAPPG